MSKRLYVSTIGDQSGVGEARRMAIALATDSGFNATDTGRVAIAVSEAAANVLKHANGGEILLRPIERGIELLAIDKGPGITHLEKALKGGSSTAGTAGIGLGAIARMASLFEVYTGPGMGTGLVAHFYPSDRRDQGTPQPGNHQPRLQVGMAQSPYPGEESCGDAWAMAGNSLFIADGLGHGIQAANAAAVAVEAFERNWQRPVRDVIEAVHLALRPTRGAAVAVAAIDLDVSRLRFCGLGNITGMVLSRDTVRGLTSHNGTAGHEWHRIAPFEYSWSEGALLVLHTDGLSARWDLKAYPGLALRHPSLVAAMLYRDFRRQRDDSTIVVARVHPPAEAGRAA